MRRSIITRAFKLENVNPYTAISELKRITLENKGAIISETNDQIESKIGSPLLLRLFGSFIWHDFLKKPLPTVIKLKVIKNIIEINLIDNAGWYLFNDPIGKSSYNKFFDYIEKVFKEI